MSCSCPRFLSATASYLRLPCALLAFCVYARFTADPAAAQEARVTDGAAIQPGAIEGTLFPPPDTHGKSAEGITITINETGQSVDTDKHGKYSFENVKPGTYTLIASGSGYSRLRITDVVVKPNRTLTLSSEAMPMVMKDGEVQVMAEVVVNANKEIQTLEKLVVTDSKPLPFTGTSNIDLPRSIDDVQPYYIWDSAKIETSGAMDIQDFFQRLVPMNTNRQSVSQQGNGFANATNINLGGLNGSSNSNTGTQNTLLLVNGLPVPNLNYNSSDLEPDLNGIPLAAVDHIEVLPASASAIYGASAAGGVVNIVLKHDYTGVELDYTYGNTFDANAPINRASLTVGAALEGGKTNLLFTASDQTEQPLKLDQRSQIWGPYQSRYFSGYPGGELAYVGITNTAGAYTTSSSGYLAQPIVTSLSGTPLFSGSTATTVQIPAGYVGGSGLAALQANVGHYNLVPGDDASLSGIRGSQYPLTLGPTEKSFDLLIRRDMTKWLEISVDLRDSSDFFTNSADYFSFNISVPATAPGNPFGQAVRVSGVERSDMTRYTSLIDNHNLSLSAKFSLPHDWKAEVNYTWGAVEFGPHAYEAGTASAALQAADAGGLINLITDLNAYPVSVSAYGEFIYSPSNSTLSAVQAKAAGPLVKLWAGAPTLALGVEHQMSGNDSNFEDVSEPSNGTVAGVATGSLLHESLFWPGANVTDNSAYSELNFPLANKANGLFGVRQLDFQGVARYDAIAQATTSPADILTENLTGGALITSPNLLSGALEPFVPNRTTFHSTTGTFGFKYKPVDDVAFRWSYSTAYVPPTYSELKGPISQGTQVQSTGAYSGVPTTSPWAYQSITDPLLGATYTVPVITGGNPSLKPETSHGIDWGVIYAPTHILTGLRVSLDYTKVTKYDDILVPSTAVLLANAAAFPGRVTRGTPNAGQSVGPVVLIDDTDINAPETSTSTYNLEVDYLFKTARAGTFKLSGIASSWQHYRIQSIPGGAFVEQLGNPYVTGTTLANGIGAGLAKFKGNIGLDWAEGPFSAGWLARYIGPYNDGAEYGLGGADAYALGTVNGWVSGQIYHDVYVGYGLDKRAAGAAWWRRALAGTKIQFEVLNLFGHIPPYDGTTSGSAIPLFMSAYGSERLAEYRLSVKKAW